MHIATAHLKSVSCYSQSRYHQTEKLPKELADDYERRTWAERLHINKDGNIFIPPMSFKHAIAEAAKFNSRKIPGERNATWTKHFEAGILVIDPLVLPMKKEDAEPEWLFLDSNGKRGSGTRVMRCYPLIREWKGKVEFFVTDDKITKDIFTTYLKEAGMYIGIGRFRVRNLGFYGRFEVVKVGWKTA